MCGIAGLIGIDPSFSRPAAERMKLALRRRGPNDEGIETIARGPGEPPAVLVHTRLSIVDLSPAGHQPMCDRPGPEHGGVPPNFVTFNGEIYNFRELGPELTAAGFPPRTRSDTETILLAYRAWGERAVERFEGMFAFCLVDVARGRVWLCRDRLGIKPLYLFRPPGGGLLFASEVRALLAAGPELVPPRLRRSALESFLAQGAVMGDDAIVDGISLLPPGTSLLTDFAGRRERQVRYWSVSFGDDRGALLSHADGSSGSAPNDHAQPAAWRSEVVTELGAALRRSVRSQLLADVPVGLFLSSGVDSGAIATLASEVSAEPLRTLSVGFDAPEYDESDAARATAEDLGTLHRHVPLTGAGVLASLDDVLGAMDQPTVDGFNTFHVARAAKQAGLTVALSGVGGDELFGGYASFGDVPRALRFSRAARVGLPVRAVRERLATVVGAAGKLPIFAGRARGLSKASETLRRPADLVALYFLRRELMTRAERRSLHALPSGSDPWSGIPRETLRALEREGEHREPVDRVAALEVSAYMRHMLLRDGDVFSMANCLELRVPLLEHYAVEQAARARSAWRLPDPRPKPLLLDAVGPRLPPRAWQAKKRGFTFPWAPWLRGPMRERVSDAIAGGGLRAAGLDEAQARALFGRFLAGDASVSPVAVVALVVIEAVVRRERLGA